MLRSTHRRTAPMVLSLLAALLAATLAGCSGGLTIRNTSDHDVSFVHRVPGGEVTHTLKPGSSLSLPSGSMVRMPDYVIEDE